MAVNLAAVLAGTGLSVTYSHWGKGEEPALPYILYLAVGSDHFGADNRVYLKRTNYQIELYSELKDVASEGLVEAALTNAGLFYQTLEAYIPEERMYQVAYTVQI